jgi:eukaryotic-like serine/threonine-protein kinase
MSNSTNTVPSPDPPDLGATRSSTGAGPLVGDDEVLPLVPGFELRDEIGRGGMGIVYRAHDTALGRAVAVKLLQVRYRAGSTAARRFAEEARITSHLTHPGIPPVHRVGALDDGRPYLVMKLIEGQTLDHELRARPDPRTDLARFVTTFEQVCQAVAFAHSRGIIHRDIKPANVMVGQFGEVQVMDWGLAKELRAPAPSADTTEVIRPGLVQFESTPEATVAGQVLGTPAYMAPEQARGEHDKIDPRSDVFGLGAVLCVILAGEPPFGSSSSDAARSMSIRGELAPAFAKLDQVRGEPELVALCKRCLSPDPAARPANAGEVADEVQRILEGAEERAVTAELDRARVETRAAELRKRRRLWAMLVAASAVLLAGAGGSLWWADHQQAERRREREVAAARDREGITAALDAAEVALRAGHLPDADAALALAEKRLADHPDADPDDRLASLVRDRDTLRDLERALDRSWTDSQKGVAAFDPAAVALYPAAFARLGLNVGTDDPDKIVAAIRASRIDDELTTGLREWYIVDPARPGLREVLNRLDPDPQRVAIRAAVAENNSDRIRALAAQVDPAKLAPGIAVLLGMHPAVPTERAIDIMAGSWQANPGNFPLALRISFRLDSLHQRRPGEALGWCRVAVALRPRSAAAHKLLANALFALNDRDAALAEYRRAIEINPNLPLAHINIGSILFEKGDHPGAVAALRFAVRVDPTNWGAHEFLGELLTKMGDHPGALEAFREAVKLRPKLKSHPQQLLTRALLEAGRGRRCADAVAELAKTHPELLTDQYLLIRANGAAGAALCGTGGGKDAPPPTERAKYRAQALAWARAELATLSDPKGISAGRVEVVRRWLTDPSFAGVRDPARLAELPAPEQAEWQKFWAEVRAAFHKP